MSTPNGSDGGPVRPDDLDVTLAVRRDLGPGSEQAVIVEFLDRVGSAIDERVDARLAARTPPAARPGPEKRPSIALPAVSIVAAIPITAITLGITDGSIGGVLLLIVAWIAIVAVNVVHSRRT